MSNFLKGVGGKRGIPSMVFFSALSIRMRPTHNLYRLLDGRKRDCKPSNISIRSHYSLNVLFWIVSFCAKIFALVSLSMTKVSDLVNSSLSAWAEQRPDFLSYYRGDTACQSSLKWRQ